MTQEDPISFRPNPAEREDIRLFTEVLELYDSVGALFHTALGIGFREMKIERGIIQKYQAPEIADLDQLCDSTKPRV